MKPSEEYKEKIKSYYNDKASVYHSSYDGQGRYPSNYYRLQICLSFLRSFPVKPSAILDAGCGDARVLAKVVEEGFPCVGFDNSENMLEEGARILQEHGCSPDLIRHGDIYDIPFESDSFDTVLCLGVLSNLQSHDQIFEEFSRVLRPGGTVIASFTNELFDLFTLNSHTLKFYDKIFRQSGMPEELRQQCNERIHEILNKDSDEAEVKIFEDKQIDKSSVELEKYSQLNLSDSMRRRGFRVEKVRHYHYHPLPTRWEPEFKEEFRMLGEAMETTDYDWKGAFMCSALVAQLSLES